MGSSPPLSSGKGSRPGDFPALNAAAHWILDFEQHYQQATSTNGKAERFIQTCKREWAYARAYAHSGARTAALGDFLKRYNCYRPHWGLGRITPQFRLTELLSNLSGSNT